MFFDKVRTIVFSKRAVGSAKKFSCVLETWPRNVGFHPHYLSLTCPMTSLRETNTASLARHPAITALRTWAVGLPFSRILCARVS